MNLLIVQVDGYPSAVAVVNEENVYLIKAYIQFKMAFFVVAVVDQRSSVCKPPFAPFYEMQGFIIQKFFRE
jgi:hypothetical protein